ncbi:MAG: nitrate/nitrite transporter NrtS [Cyanobacteria bacterium J06642_3]
MNRKVFREFTTPQNQFMAVRVAMVVGSLLFIINHGQAAINGKMTRSRWLSVSFSLDIAHAS